ncbi:MAG: ComF family protein [Candidatus Bipolaricaulia bacterium]
MKLTKVQNWKVESGFGAGLLILIEGDSLYKKILSRAFPECTFTRSFPARTAPFEWGTYIHHLDDEQRLKDFLELLSHHLHIEDDLDETYALEKHGSYGASGYQRTQLGQLVYEAKPYSSSSPGSKRKADQIVPLLVEFIEKHPAYEMADAIIPVPPTIQDKPFDLPTYLAEKVCESTRKVNGIHWIRKIRETKPQKECHTPEEKIENVYGAFQLQENIQGSSIIVLDDLYQSGATINEVGKVIRQGGSEAVYGLTITKTERHV